MHSIKEKGFITLIGLLLVVATMLFLFIKMYPVKSDTTPQGNTYSDSINKAENIKNVLETKNAESY
jgi:uncharacterized protein (UPF0333 family)